MALDFWLSMGSGAGIGVLYGLASYLGYKRALLASPRRFMLLALGGMTVRLFVAVMVITLTLVLAPVQPMPFIGSFFALFLMALVLEVLVLHRRASRAEAPAGPR